MIEVVNTRYRDMKPEYFLVVASARLSDALCGLFWLKGLRRNKNLSSLPLASSCTLLESSGPPLIYN